MNPFQMERDPIMINYHLSRKFKMLGKSYFNRLTIILTTQNIFVLQDFDHSLVHNFCFLKSEILDWFSNESDSLSLTVQNLCSDNTWIGFALYASFEFNENQNSILDILDSEGSYNLICHLETNIGSVKPRHIYFQLRKISCCHNKVDSFGSPIYHVCRFQIG